MLRPDALLLFRAVVRRIAAVLLFDQPVLRHAMAGGCGKLAVFGRVPVGEGLPFPGLHSEVGLSFGPQAGGGGRDLRVRLRRAASAAVRLPGIGRGLPPEEVRQVLEGAPRFAGVFSDA